MTYSSGASDWSPPCLGCRLSIFHFLPLLPFSISPPQVWSSSSPCSLFPPCSALIQRSADDHMWQIISIRLHFVRPACAWGGLRPSVTCRWEMIWSWPSSVMHPERNGVVMILVRRLHVCFWFSLSIQSIAGILKGAECLRSVWEMRILCGWKSTLT